MKQHGSAAQLALRSADLPDKTRAALQRIRDEAPSLTQLIITLLIAADEAGHCCLGGATTSSPRSQAGRGGLRLKCRTASVRLESRVDADADLAEYRHAPMLENLVDNAVRHAP